MNTKTQSKLDAAIDEYILRCRFNNLTERTIDSYDRKLRLFSAFLATYRDSDDLYDAVEAWKESLLRGGTKPSSVNQYLTVLSVFFEKACKRSFPAQVRFSENPVDEDMLCKVVKRPYDELLTDGQVIALFKNEPPRGAKKSLWARNYCILMVLINLKIRNAELLDLRLSDWDESHHELTVQNGKGRKMRTLDVDPLTESALRLYLESGLRPATLSDGDYLFGTFAEHRKGGARTGEAWHRGTGAWLSELVRRTVLLVTGVDNIRTHDCRHIGSRICLNAGASTEQLQGELGHSSAALVELYAGRLLQRRRRESAQAVLAARDAAAQENSSKIEAIIRSEQQLQMA